MDGWGTPAGGRFDLLLTDIKMPMMDGIEALTEIRKSKSTIPLGAPVNAAARQSDAWAVTPTGRECGTSASSAPKALHRFRTVIPASLRIPGPGSSSPPSP